MAVDKNTLESEGLGEFRTANPALKAAAFRFPEGIAGNAMTMQGTVDKTAILLFLVCGSAILTLNLWQRSPDTVGPVVIASVLCGFVTAMITIFVKRYSPITAPLYAIFEGLALGAISGLLNAQFPGIAVEAIFLTFAILGVMLVAYRTGAIEVTDKFRAGVVSATGGIVLFYLVAIVAGWLGHPFTILWSSSILGIGFSLVVVGVAALNLALDFDLIDTGVRSGAPKYMEWYGAFGLMVTLVWLYLEILRLLAKLRSRK